MNYRAIFEVVGIGRETTVVEIYSKILFIAFETKVVDVGENT